MSMFTFLDTAVEGPAKADARRVSLKESKSLNEVGEEDEEQDSDS